MSYINALNVKNSAGWVVNASSTILNSGGWIISLANTQNSYAISNTSLAYNVSSTILNSSGWSVNIVNAVTALTVAQWFCTNMTTTTGLILTQAAASSHYELYHINCNNAGLNDVSFWIVNSNSNIFRRYYLAKSGGMVAEQFSPPVAMSSTGNIYYNFVQGSNASINIAVHYRTVVN